MSSRTELPFRLAFLISIETCFNQNETFPRMSIFCRIYYVLSEYTIHSSAIPEGGMFVDQHLSAESSVH